MTCTRLLHLAFGITGWLILSTSIPAWGDIGGNALRLSAREGRVLRVQALLKSGVDANASGEFGETALFEAARFGHGQVAKLLLESGAEINARNSRDETALIGAARNCSPTIVDELLNRGADANWVNFEGRTALIEAAMGGCAGAVRLLLRVPGIRTLHQDNSGRTALDYANEGGAADLEGPFIDTARMLKPAAPSPLPRLP